MNKNIIYVDFVFKKRKVSHINYFMVGALLFLYKSFKNLLPNPSAISPIELPIRKIQ